MTVEATPGLVLILGALPVALLRGWLRGFCLLALPAIAFLLLLTLPEGDFARIELFGLQLTTLRVDGLSRLFGYAFLVAAMLGAIYALHLRDTVQHVAGLLYAGGALGAVFAGDLLTLFFFWELISVTSVFLIWAARTPRAYRAGMRYLAVQIGSGLLLLLGLMLHYRATGSLAFGAIDLNSPGGPLSMPKSVFRMPRIRTPGVTV